MKLDSKYFDSIRVSGGRGSRRADSSPAAALQGCQWAGCSKRGGHRAPKGRDSGGYYFFCREHVTEYNKSYDYFSGMNDREVVDFQKSAATGHRPTWSMGVNGSTTAGADMFRDAQAAAHAPQDPFEVLKAIRGANTPPQQDQAEVKRRVVLKGAKKHLNALNLDENATAQDIKIQFKALVKLHHPDHNGGDRGSEERFREVLAAYNYLKQAGLVR